MRKILINWDSYWFVYSTHFFKLNEQNKFVSSEKKLPFWRKKNSNATQLKLNMKVN